MLLAMLFSCDQPTDVGSNNSNNQQNQNQDNQNGENTGNEDNKDDVVTTGKIVGKATYTNTANHAGIQVTLVSSDGIVAYDSQISSRSRSTVAVMKNVVTSESGEYSFTNVKEGVYTIYASSDDSTEKAVLTNVVVQANQVVTAADLNLTATGSISGKVTIDGKENGNLGITVVIAGTSYLAVTTDAGVFTISDVPAGADYQIVIMKGDYCTLWETVSVEAGKENKLADKNITSQSSDDKNYSFIWQGSSATPPANPEKYWAYFDTDDGCSYIYDGEKWTLLAQAGKDGENGNGGGTSAEHKIIYELNGGTNSPYNPNLFLEYLTVNLKNPTRDGYCFDGWYETADFSSKMIGGWDIGEKRTDVTLYAKWVKLNDVITTTPVTVKSDSFPYGFRFCTEEGWECTYISEGAVELDEKADKVMLKVNGDVANITKEAKNKIEIDVLNDDSTKIYVDDYTLASGKLYTLTYDKKNGTVKLTEAAAGAKATSTTAQLADADGVFPAGIYISGYLGSNWAADDNAAGALLMDVVDPANEVYAFIWAAPAANVTVTLKITMADTNSTLYLKDVPVKTNGTSIIDGSIYGWNSDMGGTAVTIKNEDHSDITGGIFDAAMTATANADWALTNYVNGNADVDLAEKFGMTGANDVLQLSIDAEKFVPYVKGKVSIFSWNNAQGRLYPPFVN